MGVLGALQPSSVFRYFEEICAIPHGSGNTAAISAYCVSFAARHGLRYIRDAYNNVILFKPGCPDKAPVILQGHLDMVCVADKGVVIDFLRDPLPVDTDGEFVFSRGTSLGGDDGIAVAMILSLLEADDPAFPPIEAVLTTDEETGMFGAAGLDATVLSAKRMINLDSEEQGVILAGCAGGERVNVTLPLQRESAGSDGFRLTLTGLAGGHSGTEIDKGRLNAVRCMASLVQKSGARLVSLTGGVVDNAIPCESTAEVCGTTGSALRAAWDALRPVWQTAEPGAQLHLDGCPAVLPLTENSSDSALRLIASLPCGVQSLCRAPAGLVETSLNLGVCRTTADALELHYSLRSCVDASRAALAGTVKRIAAECGAAAVSNSAYAAWPYREHSPLRDAALRVYEACTGKSAAVQIIHAGLECGILCGKLEGLDCISIGPDIFDIHSPRERLSVASAAETYAFVRELLRTI